MLGDDLNVNLRFESFVNLEWCKTCMQKVCKVVCLRALLIQNGVKQLVDLVIDKERLRALLIQNGVKPSTGAHLVSSSLRALLIQNGVKPEDNGKYLCVSLRALGLWSERDTERKAG